MPEGTHPTQDEQYAPKIPKEVLDQLAERIKPIVRFAEGEEGLFQDELHGFPYYIKPNDIYEISYIWDPKPEERVTDLIKVIDITTYHSWEYYGFFKPTVAEVLAYVATLPKRLQDIIVAFEIVDSPQIEEDFYKTQESTKAFKAGYHTPTTRLYTLES